MNPRNRALVPSNLSGKLILGSKLVVGWEGVGESIDEELGSIGRTFVDVGGELFFPSSSMVFQLEASVTIPEGCHSQVEVDAWLP